MDKKEISKRLREARVKAGLSMADLANLAGISEKTLWNYENGRTARTKVLKRLAQILHIDYEWLIKGTPSKSEEHQKVCDLSTLIQVKFYPDIAASAGYGAIDEKEESTVMHLDRYFLQVLGVRGVKNIEIIKAVGDSMEPFIKNGEYVIIERTHVARNNEIVIAVVDGEVYVKRLQKDPVRRIVKLTSANPAYLDIELKEEELDKFRIIGVIRAKIRLL